MDCQPVPFWMVYGLGQGAPKKRHASRSSAAAEARRLADRHHGITFIVLEPVEAVSRRKGVVVTGRARAQALAPDPRATFYPAHPGADARAP